MFRYAEKISLNIDKDGEIRVSAKSREAQLPSPGKAVGEKIIETLREITHIEGEKGALPLALGIRDSSVCLGISLKSDGDHEKLIIKFPE